MCSFMRVLEDEALRGPYASYINVLRCTEAKDIKRDADGQLSVTLHNTRLNSSMDFRPNLVLGCDGINSVVRSTLQAWSAEQQGSAGSSSSGKERFRMVLQPSLSTNLRFKVLQMPANPAMVDGTVLTNPSFCLLAGQKAPLIGELLSPAVVGPSRRGAYNMHAANLMSLRPACSSCQNTPQHSDSENWQAHLAHDMQPAGRPFVRCLASFSQV